MDIGIPEFKTFIPGYEYWVLREKSLYIIKTSTSFPASSFSVPIGTDRIALASARQRFCPEPWHF
ncbi:MAG TPA: hypothetical protein VJ969_06775, partial [Desulfopila sp.]|nr:hypothetical protein [Desulfopila sp.]